MEELDLITGLSAIEEQLKAGNANQQHLHGQIVELLNVLRKPAAEPKAPEVKVSNTVQAAPAPTHDWKFEHKYDGMNRCITSIARRIPGGSA
jgi:hypothetical protein